MLVHPEPPANDPGDDEPLPAWSRHVLAAAGGAAIMLAAFIVWLLSL